MQRDRFFCKCTQQQQVNIERNHNQQKKKVNATEKIPNIEAPLAKEDYLYEKCCDFIG